VTPVCSVCIATECQRASNNYASNDSSLRYLESVVHKVVRTKGHIHGIVKKASGSGDDGRIRIP
jgi:hypothetical protein